jgi:hypothetical protein
MHKKLITILRELKRLEDLQDSHLAQVPDEYVDALFGNAYTNSLGMQKDLLLHELFGKDSEEVCWFLYEYNADTDTDFQSYEEFYSYLDAAA